MARGIRAQCLADGLPPAEIALAIHERCQPTFGTTLIRAHRLALGIALADVVAQVRARYVTEGRLPPRFSETLLSSYESGQKRPGPEYLHYLCNVYQAEPADLGYPGQCLCGRTHRAPALQACRRDRVRPGAGWRVAAPAPPRAVPAPPPDRAGAVTGAGQAGQPAGVAMPVAESSPGEADDDLVRRNLLRLMADPGAEAEGRFFGAAERIRRRLDDALLGATVSVTMLDHWEEMAAEYGRLYMTVPPMRLLCDVLLDLGDVRRMCEQRQPLEFAERLCQLAARLAGLAGMTMIDVGDQRLARSFFSTARTAADETGDRQLRAWVAVREALVPLYYGDPAQAAAAARASADLAGQRPCVASAMAPIVEARALARLARARGKGGRPAGPRPPAQAAWRPARCPGSTRPWNRPRRHWTGCPPRSGAAPRSVTPSASCCSTPATRWSPWATTGARTTRSGRPCGCTHRPSSWTGRWSRWARPGAACRPASQRRRCG